jgi:hypothetical protein
MPRSIKKAHVIGMLVLAFGLLATPVLMPSVGNAQDARIAISMAALKDQTTKLGAPKIDGKDAVGGRDAPALYFGSTKMNNNFSVVDEVAEEGGRGMAATLFVKSGDDYIRVATNVSMRIGSGRGLGTILTGAPLESIKAGKAYYGKASILGTPYVSGYEPIKDASGATTASISSATRSDARLAQRGWVASSGGLSPRSQVRCPLMALSGHQRVSTLRPLSG